MYKNNQNHILPCSKVRVADSLNRSQYLEDTTLTFTFLHIYTHIYLHFCVYISLPIIVTFIFFNLSLFLP